MTASNRFGRLLGPLGVAAGLAACLVFTACSSSGGAGPAGTTAPSRAGGQESGSSLSALLPTAIRSSGSLTIATSADYPPFEFVGTDGQTIGGFDPDLGRAIGKVLGVNVKFINAGFDGLIPGVAAGKYTAVMAGVQDKKVREQTVSFVDYVLSGSDLAVVKGNPQHISSFSDLCGKAVAVEKGTTQVGFAQSQSKKCTNAGHQAIGVRIFNTENDANLALASNRVAAVFAESPTQAYAAKTSGKLQIVGPIYDKQRVGVVLPKGQKKLAQAFQKAIQKLISNGTYKNLLAKWNMQSGAIPQALINQPLS